MKKSTQQLIIILITFFSLSIIIFFIWRQTTGQPTPLTSDSTKKSTITDPYLKEAKDILNHFSAHTDQYGFYGLMQECQKNQNKYECQVKKEKIFGHFDYQEGEERAAWRDGLKVIWARFNYYQATNDQEELTRLEQDIDNLITKVVDNPSTVLQSGDFTCLYLAPIIESSDVSQKARDQAKRLCLESTIEYAPLSSVIFSQYPRQKVIVTGYSGDDENLPILGTVSDTIPEEMITIYTKEEITSQINANLAKMDAWGPYDSFSFLMPMKEQPKFFQREAAAAVDQIFKMQLAKKEGNTELYNLTEIEYLLLIDELFSWYMINILELEHEGICLFYQALNYYFNHYPHPLTQAQIAEYADIYWTTPNSDLLCNLANISLNRGTIEPSSLQQKIADRSMADWSKGLLGLDNSTNNSHQEKYIFPVGYNALIAGLYSFSSSPYIYSFDFANSINPNDFSATNSSALEDEELQMEGNVNDQY